MGVNNGPVTTIGSPLTHLHEVPFVVPAKVSTAPDYSGRSCHMAGTGLIMMLLAVLGNKTPAFPSSKEVISNVGLKASLPPLLTWAGTRFLTKDANLPWSVHPTLCAG